MCCISFASQRLLNSFLDNVPLAYSLKTPENLWFPGVFRGNKMRTLSINGLSIDSYKTLNENCKLITANEKTNLYFTEQRYTYKKSLFLDFVRF